jgi:hypothetical protein
VLYNNKSPEEAYEPLKVYEPYMPFRDAAVGLSTFHLTPFHCINAIMYARDRNLFDFHKTFNIEEYEYFECVENGDLSVLVHDKFIAFAGPHATRRSPDGYPTFTPEDYVPIFKKYNVTHVVRLNRKLYNKQRFTEAGFGHTDLYFVDGTCPSMQASASRARVCLVCPFAGRVLRLADCAASAAADGECWCACCVLSQILNQFLDLCATDKYLAVHCKAGPVQRARGVRQVVQAMLTQTEKAQARRNTLALSVSQAWGALEHSLAVTLCRCLGCMLSVVCHCLDPRGCVSTHIGYFRLMWALL